MVKRILLDKSTTIINGSDLNYGLNPICMLNHGAITSRFLIHFDTSKIKEMIEDKTLLPQNTTYRIKMKNCGSLNNIYKQKMTSTDINGIKERATSFTIIAFTIPQKWDEGVGFDSEGDIFETGKGVYSSDGATWKQASNEEVWLYDGIYPTDILIEEYKEFKKEKPSIIIGEQHFDHGNEDIDIDITNYINSIVLSSDSGNTENSGNTITDDSGNTFNIENNGICFAFAPILENDNAITTTQYVGFFNNKTNTIFEPVIECRTNEGINDDRMDFVLDRDNKLYFYSFIGGKLKNLDELPTCYIDELEETGKTVEVIQKGKGIYAALLRIDSEKFEKDMILHDIWGNIKYHGKKFKDIELEFVTKESEEYFSFGSKIKSPRILSPIVNGISFNEDISQEEVRHIKVFFKELYTHTNYTIQEKCWYKIYAKDGNKEYTVIDWDYINKTNNCSSFNIDMNGLTPARYYVDIKAQYGDETRIYKEQLIFNVVSNSSKIKL